jgi:hypothetical protein
VRAIDSPLIIYNSSFSSVRDVKKQEISKDHNKNTTSPEQEKNISDGNQEQNFICILPTSSENNIQDKKKSILEKK